MQRHEIGDVGILELMHVRNGGPGLRHVRGDLPSDRWQRFPSFRPIRGGVGTATGVRGGAAFGPLPHKGFHVIGGDPAAGLRPLDM